MLCYLIDDDEDDRDFFAMAVEEVKGNIQVKSSGSADEALEALRARAIRPDIIFLDLNMPRIDGWECLKLLREMQHLAEIPVIIYSTSDKGWNSRPHAGYTDFLTKQSRISDLVQKLQEIFSKVNV
jgi:CheY-like chemotaxis protein